MVLVDTAGRLHNKQNLMNELNKISRIIDRELPGCDRETLLVLDATTGQNGLIQPSSLRSGRDHRHCAHQAGRDGQRRVVLAIAKEMGVPGEVRGPGGGDRRSPAFDPAAFAEALV